MSKQTSVEWLIDQVEDFIGLIPIDIIAKAKQLHKQEVVDAFNSGDFIHHYNQDIDKDGHEYYDEIYGGNNG